MKHELKKAEILKAAARVFRRKGFHATRIQDVAEELNMQKGSLYYYIKTKEDLLKGMVEDVLERSVVLVNAIRDTEHSPTEKIRLLIETHLKLFHENIDAFGMIISEDMALIAKNSDRDVYTLMKKYERGWNRIFEEGVAAGEFRADANYKMIVKGILGMLNWSYRWYHLAEGYSIEQVSDIFSDLILNGVKGTPKP